MTSPARRILGPVLLGQDLLDTPPERQLVLVKQAISFSVVFSRCASCINRFIRLGIQ